MKAATGLVGQLVTPIARTRGGTLFSQNLSTSENASDRDYQQTARNYQNQMMGPVLLPIPPIGMRVTMTPTEVGTV